MNIERAVAIAGYYERNKNDKELIKRYLEENLNGIDAFIILGEIRKEIDRVQDIQDEHNYTAQLKSNPNTEPKRIEIILSKDAMTDAAEMSIEKIRETPMVTKNTLVLLSSVAYKYQLKYTSVILEEMLIRDDIWTEVTMH